jgi:hypothetical protein
MNMQTKTLYTAAVLVMIQLAAQAQSINVAYYAGVGQRDIFYNGSAVADGNQVRVGFFTAGFDVAANAANLNALNGAWTQFDTTSITNVFGQPGHFSDNASSFDPVFESKKICLWIFKTVNDGVPTANFDNVLGYGVFSSSANNWVFPQGSAVPPNNSTTIVSDDVNQTYFGLLNGTHLSLAPVPEPSTYALLALGAVPLLMARRLFNKRTALK